MPRAEDHETVRDAATPADKEFFLWDDELKGFGLRVHPSGRKMYLAQFRVGGRLRRGDGHYARPEAMAWCEANGLQFVFGLPGSKPLSRKVEDTADAVRTPRAVGDKDVVRDDAETRHRAGSWSRERRAVARIEATRLGLDIRFVVTNVERGSPAWVYDSLSCALGQAENLIKLHKSQLRSECTSCRSALANQVRLVLHTAAYWLMLDVRDAIPKG